MHERNARINATDSNQVTRSLLLLLMLLRLMLERELQHCRPSDLVNDGIVLGAVRVLNTAGAAGDRGAVTRLDHLEGPGQNLGEVGSDPRREANAAGMRVEQQQALRLEPRIVRVVALSPQIAGIAHDEARHRILDGVASCVYTLAERQLEFDEPRADRWRQPQEDRLRRKAHVR